MSESPHPTHARHSIIVSNRLPFSVGEGGGLTPSSGGLVTAIKGIELDAPATWLGAAPPGLEEEGWRARVEAFERDEGEALRYEAVFLDDALYDAYYNGMCNDVIWPLLHYKTQDMRFTPEAWEAYLEVNARFADAIVEAAAPDSMIWLHDFHLFMLPRLLRERAPGLRIGFFLHVPFPSSEVFRQLPVREEVLRSLMETDLIGFHDYDYLRHFCAALRVLLGVDTNLLAVSHGDGRVTRLGVFPVGINTGHFQRVAGSEGVARLQDEYARSARQDKLLLGVDRLDYTKGLDLKLEAFEHLLEAHPELRGEVRLLQLAVPSRTDVPEYVRLREAIERKVGAINGRFGTPQYVPVHYMFTSVPFEELLALYRLADVLLVTSKRDGMNLVAQEFVATQPSEDPGVLVLSEFAGAASVLSHALHVNPWNIAATAARVHEALQMTREERIRRHRPMLSWLESYTASTWANTFFRALGETRDRAIHERVVESDGGAIEAALERLDGEELLLLVDYDGTLAPIAPTPAEATLSAEARACVQALAEVEGARVVVVSGRDEAFLSEQLAGLPVALAAEHGGAFRPWGEPGWLSRVNGVGEGGAGWRAIVQGIFDDFSARTPDSFTEHKRFGLAWHYRRSPERFANHQAFKLVQELRYALFNMPVTILEGRKVVEVRAAECNKGAFARWLLHRLPTGEGGRAIVAVGDDTTDEDLFEALPEGAVTVKVGDAATVARYRLRDQARVLPFLRAVTRRWAT